MKIQYMPVRSDALDIIETQVAENDGKLVEFSPGVISVTLHFKHKWIFLLDLTQPQEQERVYQQHFQSFQDPVTESHTSGWTRMESGAEWYILTGPQEHHSFVDEGRHCAVVHIVVPRKESEQQSKGPSGGKFHLERYQGSVDIT